MINPEKLFCAFIVSAYDSGHCNHGLSEPLKNAHMALLEKFILTGNYFPHGELLSTHPTATKRSQETKTRPYIYNEHLEKIKQSIEKTSQLPFSQAMQNRVFSGTAIGCSVSPYHVLSLDEKRLVGKHLYGEFEKELIILPGLEIPEKGSLISGHWNHYLEIMGDEDIDEYLPIIKKYFSEIRKK